MNANPELVVASAWKPSASSTRADPASHGFGITNGSPTWRARNRSAFSVWLVIRDLVRAPIHPLATVSTGRGFGRQRGGAAPAKVLASAAP